MSVHERTSRSLIPDVKPRVRLATQRVDELPQYSLLVKTIRTTLFSCGRFPQYLRKDSDFVESLVDDGVTLGMSLLGESDAEVISGAKSIARQLIHREKVETRWVETDETGKKVRKSKAVMRIEHPVKRHGDVNADPFWGAEGDKEWCDPMGEVGVDADGRLVSVTPLNFNEVEHLMIEHLDFLRQRLRVIDAIGPDKFRWMVEYVDRKKTGVPVSPADRTRFKTLKKKAREATHETGRLDGR